MAIMGAVIHAGSTVHRVHAPSTHSLPAIRACFRPFMPNNQTAEITILSVSMSGIRQLKEISPAFSRIWNHRSLPVEQSSPNIDFSQRSFTFVSSIFGCALKSSPAAKWLTRLFIYLIFSSNPLRMTSTEDHFTRLNVPFTGGANLIDIEIP